MPSDHSDSHPQRAHDATDWDDCDWDEDDYECTHCGGDGICMAGANPLWDCDDNPHPCHACRGSGKRRDQTVF